jgi:hypothetical protein
MADTTSSTESDPARSGPDGPAQPPRSGRSAPALTRVFVFGFLAAMLICGVFVIEAWPLTGFRLFSHLRYPRLLGWQATTVDRAGRETIIHFAAFPRTYRHLPLIMRTYGGLPQARQEAICQAWAAEVRRHGREVTGVRIYRTVVDLRRHRNRRHQPPARRLLRFTCADGRGARAAA